VLDHVPRHRRNDVFSEPHAEKELPASVILNIRQGKDIGALKELKQRLCPESSRKQSNDAP
jgi:hypothetical protein